MSEIPGEGEQPNQTQTFSNLAQREVQSIPSPWTHHLWYP